MESNAPPSPAAGTARSMNRMTAAPPISPPRGLHAEMSVETPAYSSNVGSPSVAGGGIESLNETQRNASHNETGSAFRDDGVAKFSAHDGSHSARDVEEPPPTPHYQGPLYISRMREDIRDQKSLFGNDGCEKTRLRDYTRGACLLIPCIRTDPAMCLHISLFGCFVGTSLGRVAAYLFEPVQGPWYHYNEVMKGQTESKKGGESSEHQASGSPSGEENKEGDQSKVYVQAEAIHSQDVPPSLLSSNSDATFTDTLQASFNHVDTLSNEETNTSNTNTTANDNNNSNNNNSSYNDDNNNAVSHTDGAGADANYGRQHRNNVAANDHVPPEEGSPVTTATKLEVCCMAPLLASTMGTGDNHSENHDCRATHNNFQGQSDSPNEGVSSSLHSPTNYHNYPQQSFLPDVPVTNPRPMGFRRRSSTSLERTGRRTASARAAGAYCARDNRRHNNNSSNNGSHHSSSREECEGDERIACRRRHSSSGGELDRRSSTSTALSATSQYIDHTDLQHSLAPATHHRTSPASLLSVPLYHETSFHHETPNPCSPNNGGAGTAPDLYDIDSWFIKPKSLFSQIKCLGQPRSDGPPLYYAYPNTYPRGRLMVYCAHAENAAKALYVDAVTLTAIIGPSLMKRWPRVSPARVVVRNSEGQPGVYTEAAARTIKIQNYENKMRPNYVMEHQRSAILIHPGPDGWHIIADMATEAVAGPETTRLPHVGSYLDDYVPCDFCGDKLMVAVRKRDSPPQVIVYAVSAANLTPRLLGHRELSKSSKFLTHFKFWEPDRFVYVKHRTIIAENYITGAKLVELKGHKNDIVAVYSSEPTRILSLSSDGYLKIWTDFRSPTPECLLTVDCSPATFFLRYSRILRAYGPLVVFSADQGVFFTNLRVYDGYKKSQIYQEWEQTEAGRLLTSVADDALQY